MEYSIKELEYVKDYAKELKEKDESLGKLKEENEILRENAKNVE